MPQLLVREYNGIVLQIRKVFAEVTGNCSQVEATNVPGANCRLGIE